MIKWYFDQIAVTTISEASCHAFQYEKVVFKMMRVQQTRTRISWRDIDIGLNLIQSYHNLEVVNSR